MEDSHLQKGWIEPRKMVDFIREKSGWSYSYPSENMKVTWDDYSRNMEKTKHVLNHKAENCRSKT